jgi:hypothetical protein
MKDESKPLRPLACVSCNAHPDDIVDITELTDATRRWCCGVCDAVWLEAPGSGMVQILAEGGQ